MNSFCAAKYLNWSVYGVPAFETNYIWFIVNSATQRTIVVDPGCFKTVQRFVQAEKLLITDVLITHHHQDHIGGLQQLLQDKTVSSPHLQIIGTTSGRIEHITTPVQHQQTVVLNELSIVVYEVPGHTLDHLAFYIPIANQPNWLFCGDTLFSAGCGRIFESTHEQMFNSLKMLSHLPDNTFVFCAHEYTVSNLEFLAHYEPTNLEVINQLSLAKQLRDNQQSTIPSLIVDEKRFNLFFRAESVETFTKLRKSKDIY